MLTGNRSPFPVGCRPETDISFFSRNNHGLWVCHADYWFRRPKTFILGSQNPSTGDDGLRGCDRRPRSSFFRVLVVHAPIPKAETSKHHQTRKRYLRGPVDFLRQLFTHFGRLGGGIIYGAQST